MSRNFRRMGIALIAFAFVAALPLFAQGAQQAPLTQAEQDAAILNNKAEPDRPLDCDAEVGELHDSKLSLQNRRDAAQFEDSLLHRRRAP